MGWARESGATDIVEERGDAGAAKVKELTNGLGAHGSIEANRGTAHPSLLGQDRLRRQALAMAVSALPEDPPQLARHLLERHVRHLGVSRDVPSPRALHDQPVALQAPHCLSNRAPGNRTLGPAPSLEG